MNADEELVQRALEGDQTSLTRLVAKLTPVIQSRVVRTLKARRPLRLREVEDLSQEVFVALFSRDGHILRSWQSERGLSLENFVGLVTERRVLSILRPDWWHPWQEESFLDDENEIEIEAQGSDPEVITASRELLSQLLDWLREGLSPLGYHMFQLIFIQELSQAEVEAATGLSADAVYKWRSRLRRLVKKLLDEMSGNPGPARKT